MKKYDFFIAHASGDSLIAKNLYKFLTPHFKVFLDIENLSPGDLWDEIIPQAQQNSKASLIIVTDKTEKSFYQNEEITYAIELLREKVASHRVIPLFFGEIFTKKNIPYGLRRINGIHVPKNIENLSMENFYKALSDFHFGHSIEYVESKTQRNIQKSPKRNVRKIFEDQIQSIIKEHFLKNKKTYLIYIDVDKFTLINKVYGKEIGDKVILKLNELIGESCREIYHLNISGDQFVICPRFYNESITIDLIRNLQYSISKYDWSQFSNSLFVSCSFGYSELYRSENSNFDFVMNEWIIRAIYGCRKAKKNGGNSDSLGPLILKKSERFRYEEAES